MLWRNIKEKQKQLTRVTLGKGVMGWRVIQLTYNVNTLYLQEVQIFEKSQKGGKDSRFFCKNRGRVINIEGVVYRREGYHCFSLMIYGFCSKNVLYSASVSFTIFIFLLTSFDTWHCYYFKSNLTFVLHMKCCL